MGPCRKPQNKLWTKADTSREGRGISYNSMARTRPKQPRDIRSADSRRSTSDGGFMSPRTETKISDRPRLQRPELSKTQGEMNDNNLETERTVKILDKQLVRFFGWITKKNKSH